MLKPILLIEDNPRDLELTLVALERSQLANDVIVLRDGAEALDYLFRRNDHAQRADGNPAVMLLDLKLPKIDGLEVLKAVRDTPSCAVSPSSCSPPRGRSPTCSAPTSWGERLCGEAGRIQGIRRGDFRPGHLLGRAQRTAARLAAPPAPPGLLSRDHSHAPAAIAGQQGMTTTVHAAKAFEPAVSRRQFARRRVGPADPGT